MNPTTPADHAPPEQPLVEFVRGQRRTAAYIFLGLSVVFLAATILLAVRAFRVTKADADPAPAAKTLDPANPDPPKLEIADPKKPSYMFGWVGGAFACLVAGVAGGVLLVGLPKPTAAGQRTEARVLLLAVGGLLGFGLIVFGLIYFYLWSDSLTKWLDKGEAKERVWVIITFLMVVAGAGLVFAAVQPARAEERDNTLLRKVVYGANFGLVALLLVVVLVVANVVVSLKVPNKLDTTETGFYSLSDSTKAFLGKMTEPVNLYVILPNSEERDVNDIRQFALTAQDASDGKVTTRFISPVSNKAELARLQDKYQRVGRDALGVLLTVGPDEKRHAFVPVADLFEVDPRSGQLKGFAGEAKIMRELRFLAENELKPVVYFTQGNGELSLGGGPDAAGALGPSATQLKGFLEKAYVDVKPLVLPAQSPAVPDDAAVVVVAEPQSPLAEPAVAAIRKYMSSPRPGDRKGKLIVLAGAASGAEKQGVAKTGLEGLLAEFNVRLGDKFIYTSDPSQQLPNWAALAVFAKASEQNPITQTLAPQVRAYLFQFPREVEALTTNPTYQATSLLITAPGRPTWLEDDRVADLEQTVRDLEENPGTRARKGLTDRARSVAAVVSEGGTGRAVVVGNAFLVTDRMAERSRSGTPTAFDLVAVAIDWLRDKPPVAAGIESKKYKEYTFPEPSAVDSTRLLWFPLGLGVLLVSGVGAGVWVIRRK